MQLPSGLALSYMFVDRMEQIQMRNEKLVASNREGLDHWVWLSAKHISYTSWLLFFWDRRQKRFNLWITWNPTLKPPCSWIKPRLDIITHRMITCIVWVLLSLNRSRIENRPSETDQQLKQKWKQIQLKNGLNTEWEGEKNSTQMFESHSLFLSCCAQSKRTHISVTLLKLNCLLRFTGYETRRLVFTALWAITTKDRLQTSFLFFSNQWNMDLFLYFYSIFFFFYLQLLDQPKLPCHQGRGTLLLLSLVSVVDDDDDDDAPSSPAALLQTGATPAQWHQLHGRGTQMRPVFNQH